MSESRRQPGAVCGIVVILVLTCCAPAVAQTVIPSESSRVARLFASLDDLIAGEQWDRALDLLEQIAATERESVVRVAPGHLLNAAEMVRWRLTNLPPPLLVRYRERWEPRAAAWLADAEVDPHPDRWQQIVEEAFATRAAERAILLWGDERLQRGEFEQARQIWRMLVPDPNPGTARLLRFPDPETPAADILARLLLCSLFEGDATRAARELDWLAERFPDATGTLAGERGRWIDLLRTVQRDAAGDSRTLPMAEVVTFAGSFTRNERSPAPLDVGAIAWSRTFPPDGFPVPEPMVGHADSARLFPLLWRELAFLATGDEIHAVRIDDGAPAWSAHPVPGGALGDATRLYPPLGEIRRIPSRPIVGTLAETATIDGGRLFARMGGPVTLLSEYELQPSQSRLVCLDIAAGEGILRWEQPASMIDPRLQFEGVPVVSGDRLLMLGRRDPAPAQLHLICLDPRDGRFLWNREICSGSLPVASGENFASHHLLATFGDIGYINTELGAIVACDLRDGRPLWFHEYARREQRAGAGSVARDSGPAHCVVQDGIVFARPGDSDQLLALDGQLGQRLWSRSVADDLQLLGVVDGRVLLAGSFLECRSASDGGILWRVGSVQDEWRSAGRGLITPHEVWWPTATEIIVVDHVTGRITRRVPLEALHGLAGGNLLSDGHSLLISGPEGLTRFSPFGRRPAQSRNESGNP